MYRSSGRTNPPVGYTWPKLRLVTLLNWKNNIFLITLQESQHLSGVSNILCNSVILLLDALSLNILKG